MKINNTFSVIVATILIIITIASMIMLPVSLIGIIWNIFEFGSFVWLKILCTDVIVLFVCILLIKFWIIV